MKYLLRYHYHVFSHITGSLESGLTQHMKPVYKLLLFHHSEDVDNYIRNNVSASTLIKLELDYAEVG